MWSSIETPSLAVARALLWGSFFCIPLAQAMAQNGVGVSFALERSNVTLNEPVRVRLTIENHLKEPISLDLGFKGKENLQFIVTEPGGSIVSPPRVREGGIGRSGVVSVEPDGISEEHILLNEWYQPPQPGPYRIRPKLVDTNLRTQSGISLSNQTLSPPMALRIAPRDPGRLSEVCQGLVEGALTPSDYGQRAESALALSYMLDPVAIPYLGRVAKDPQVGRLAVLGLARIANLEGMERVISGLDPRDPQLEASIRSALNAIRLGAHVAD